MSDPYPERVDEPPFSGRAFRDALSAFATGVTIVTTCDEHGEPVGMTASSFNSVSVDPPLVLWSVTKTALSAPVFKAARHFSIHVLAADQSETSNVFSRSGTDKFADVSFRIDERRVPILEGSASRFDCSTWAVYEGGDHWIIVGRVENLESSAKEGLVFGGGTYATASPIATSVQDDDEAPQAESLIESLLFYHLSRAYHQLGHEFHEAVRRTGLTVSEWRVCASLYDQVTRSRSELSRRTFLDPESLDLVLEGMEADGLCLQSAPDQVSGTEKGSKTVAHLFDLAREQEESALARLPAKDAAVLKSSLRRMIGHIERDR